MGVLLSLAEDLTLYLRIVVHSMRAEYYLQYQKKIEIIHRYGD